MQRRMMRHKKKNKQLAQIIIIIFLLMCTLLFVSLPKSFHQIRIAEIRSLVVEDNLSRKVHYLDIEEADAFIQKKSGVTILFSIPSGEVYNKIISVFKNKQMMTSFNRSLYIYPLLYNSEEIEKKYGLNKADATIIFFENGEEKNRLVIDKEMDITSQLIPLMNELPLAST